MNPNLTYPSNEPETSHYCKLDPHQHDHSCTTLETVPLSRSRVMRHNEYLFQGCTSGKFW